MNLFDKLKVEKFIYENLTVENCELKGIGLDEKIIHILEDFMDQSKLVPKLLKHQFLLKLSQYMRNQSYG